MDANRESEEIVTIDYDDKGKIFTDVVSKTVIPAVIQTTQHLVRGNIHVRHDERLKDELDRDKLFLAITDATVVAANGQELHKTRFLAVRRTQIVWVMPADDSDKGGEG
jgi:hypothetical protein